MFYTLLKAHAILRDVIPLCLVFDDNNHLVGFFFGPHVTPLLTKLTMIYSS